jgi:hypothetical protein
LRAEVEIPGTTAKSLDGIISYLRKKHGASLHENGIVRISSKSADDDPKYALTNVADFLSNSRFRSKDEPGQWVCWDFGEMRVRPTQYTIRAWGLKLWVVEGSLDGEDWRRMDRQANTPYFKKWNTWTFDVSTTCECRFIRLTQIDKKHCGNHVLSLGAVEFFGTLCE